MTDGMERRDFIRSVGLLAGAAAAAIDSPALAQTTSNAGFKAMTYEIKPLPFDPKTIKGLSEKLLVSHYENNYTARSNGLTRSAPNSPNPTSPSRLSS